MRKTFAVMLGATAALTAAGASAGELEEANARLELLERQNAAIRKENAALRENQRLLAENRQLQSQGARPRAEPRTVAMQVNSASRSTRESSAFEAVSALSQRSRDPLQAYASDLSVKARPAAAGQFRAWIESGAIWSGGDPVYYNYGVIGQFDLTPRVGWESAIGFDHRFAGSPWHISGQFRYGESGKAAGQDSSTISGAIGAATETYTETFGASYKEKRWLADLAIGRDVAGSGASALQLKGGLRVAEFVTRNSNSDIQFATFVGAAPLVTGYSVQFSYLNDTRSSFLGAGPVIGVDGSVPFAGKWSFDYAGDVALLLGRQESVSNFTGLFSVTPSYLASSFPFANSHSTSSSRMFAGVLSADIQVGVSYWLTQKLKLGASYRLDALINAFNESGSSSANLTPDRYTHGPRVTLTGQFDAM